MSKALATKAKILNDDCESRAGWCQRWTREKLIQTYGQKKYEKYFERYMKDDAYLTMLAFKKSKYAVPVENGSVVGDILYKGRKTSGTFGHVGIRIAGNKVAENSSSHVNPRAGDHDARGTRSLDAYGAYELIVRLPEPSQLA